MISELVSGSGKIVTSPSKSLLMLPAAWTTGFLVVDAVVLAPDTLALVVVAAFLEAVEVFVAVPVLPPDS